MILLQLMSYVIIGLGNPGDEYKTTRHNVGRIMVERFRKKYDFPMWSEEKKKGFLISKGKIGKHTITLILPELFMNKSGNSIKSLITNQKKAEQLVVVYDDIDLGLSDYKISFGRGSGGHRGIESVIKSIKTKNFIRVRIGIAPTTVSGKIRKPKGENKVLGFLMGDFGKKEIKIIQKTSVTVNKILETIIEEGVVSAMNIYN